jgi:CRP-like cAMP-binding protein
VRAPGGRGEFGDEVDDGARRGLRIRRGRRAAQGSDVIVTQVTPALVEELRAIALLSALDAPQLERVITAMRVRGVGEGELLFQTGDAAAHFFYLRSGCIKLFRHTPDGGEKVIELVQARQTFAEAVMFMERSEYPVSAQVVAAGELYVFEMATMLEMLRGSTDTCFRMLGALSRRLRHHVEEIDRLTLHSATFRLASYLLQRCVEHASGPCEVRLDAPKHIIASRLAIQPETFSRILARLSKQGVIEVEGNVLRLRDVARLRELVAA